MRVDALPDLSSSWEGLRAALVIAHPGHELRIHHWLERVKPRVFVQNQGPLGRRELLIEPRGLSNEGSSLTLILLQFCAKPRATAKVTSAAFT